jgi:hypothetical protein
MKMVPALHKTLTPKSPMRVEKVSCDESAALTCTTAAPSSIVTIKKSLDQKERTTPRSPKKDAAEQQLDHFEVSAPDSNLPLPHKEQKPHAEPVRHCQAMGPPLNTPAGGERIQFVAVASITPTTTVYSFPADSGRELPPPDHKERVSLQRMRDGALSTL